MSDVNPFIEALRNAGQSDLEAIEAQIERHNSELAILRAAQRVLSAKCGCAPASTGNGKQDPDDLRALIYDYITANGPSRPSVIGQALGLSHTSVGRLANHEWFKKDGKMIANA